MPLVQCRGAHDQSHLRVYPDPNDTQANSPMDVPHGGGGFPKSVGKGNGRSGWTGEVAAFKSKQLERITTTMESEFQLKLYNLVMI